MQQAPEFELVEQGTVGVRRAAAHDRPQANRAQEHRLSLCGFVRRYERLGSHLAERQEYVCAPQIRVQRPLEIRQRKPEAQADLGDERVAVETPLPVAT